MRPTPLSSSPGCKNLWGEGRVLREGSRQGSSAAAAQAHPTAQRSVRPSLRHHKAPLQLLLLTLSRW